MCSSEGSNLNVCSKAEILKVNFQKLNYKAQAKEPLPVFDINGLIVVVCRQWKPLMVGSSFPQPI